eukprot:2069196-Pyramimonas_sp.AAC.1
MAACSFTAHLLYRWRSWGFRMPTGVGMGGLPSDVGPVWRSRLTYPSDWTLFRATSRQLLIPLFAHLH